MTGPQFLSVNGSSFSLTNLVLVSEADTAGGITIQTLNNWGGQDETTEEYTWNGTGWEDAYGAPVSDVTFAPGKGLWVYNFTGEAVTFQSAGQVNEIDVTYPLDLDFGAVAIVNPYPTDLALADITFVTEADIAGSITIQTLNNWGGQDETTEEYTWNGTGWEDAYGIPVSDVTFAPGKGLWVYNFTGEAVGFHMPAPEL